MNRLTETTDPTVEMLPRAAHALGALDDLVTRRPPLRAAIVGGAGSGKTDALAYLRGRLDRDGRPTHLWSARDSTDPVDDDVTLLVDDAQELDEKALGTLLERAHRPDAGLVIAYRTWPAPPALVEITRVVEHDSPPLLLGEVTLAEVRTDLLSADAACAQHILDISGGTAWLVAACVEAHDLQDCSDDPEHRELARVVRRRVQHRLEPFAAASRPSASARVTPVPRPPTPRRSSQRAMPRDCSRPTDAPSRSWPTRPGPARRSTCSSI